MALLFSLRQHQNSGAAGNLMARLPGVGLCVVVAMLAYTGQLAEQALFSKAWLEALVLAILIGAALRSLWSPGPWWCPGIDFSAKYLLEFAVVLLGASVSAGTIMAAGPGLLAGIAAVVFAALVISFTIGRMLGLPPRMALLVSCGNSICGNSAIAAVAPVIGADSEDVAAAIAFTAVLGVAVVLVLPLIGLAWGMSAFAFGALAGLTVYAVPQVIAAASPMGPVAMQMGTLVKLMRVLMLGPVCVIMAMLAPRLSLKDASVNEWAVQRSAIRKPTLGRLVPWFIVGFVLLALARALGLIPASALVPLAKLASVLTVISMAALGLGVDIRSIAAAGSRVTATVVLSLASLGAISLVLLDILHFL